MSEQMKLLSHVNLKQSFFIADIFDNLPFKDDVASMEHPFFCLSKKKDMRVLNYTSGDISLTIIPSALGLPTIFDKDILLYSCSILMNEINKGRIPPKTLRVSFRDLLIAVNRAQDGRTYTRLKQTLERLRGVTIKTNIKTNKHKVTSAFGLIDNYRIIESSRVKDRMVRLEITLSEWLYNSVIGKEVLTINRDYFLLEKPVERRLYEIFRKHCGSSPEWRISLASLKDKTGSISTLAKFRFIIRRLIEEDHLPDYNISLLGEDIVVCKPRKGAHLFDLDNTLLKYKTIIKAQEIVEQANTALDYNELLSQFTQQLLSGFSPDNVDGAFINFIKKKVTCYQVHKEIKKL